MSNKLRIKSNIKLRVSCLSDCLEKASFVILKLATDKVIMAINWPQLLVWKGTSKMRNLFFFVKKDQNIVTLARISQHLIFECDPSYPSITQNRDFCYIFSIDYLKILFKPFLTSWTNQRQTRKLQTLYPTSTPHPRPQVFPPKKLGGAPPIFWGKSPGHEVIHPPPPVNPYGMLMRNRE